MGRPLLVRFLGGTGTVTGSKFLVYTARSRVLVDCGLFQGRKDLRLRNWSGLPLSAGGIDAVVLTHAHLDHCGYLPVLAAGGFRGGVFATSRTADLVDIVLDDAARLQEEEADYANRQGFSRHRPALPLYTSEDAAAAARLLRPVPFGQRLAIAEDVQIELQPAGHILGSATVALHVDDPDRVVLFSGDLGRPDHPVLRPPALPGTADVVVVESTYGNRRHEDDAAALARFADVINRTAHRGGVVVLPAFAVDRTEVVLVALRRLVAAGRIPPLPVYVDSPMALAVLEVYRDAIAADEPDVDLERVSGDPFDATGHLHEALTRDASRAINAVTYPSIIVSSSGMATGGRVLHHLERRLPDPRNSVVLVGFQAEATRGRSLLEGRRTVRIHGREVPVKAEVVAVDAFSAHADAGELLAWLGAAPQRPQAAFVVHGELSASEALRDRVTAELHWSARVPADGEQVRID